MNIVHTDVGDLDVFLICPNGTRLELSSDNNSGGDNFTNTCFTRTGSSITSGTAPFTGNFIPEGPNGLAAFNGCTANGTWRLAVYDDANGDIGYIDNWTLTINNYFEDFTMNYVWTPAAGMSGTSMLTPTVSPSVTTTYILTGTNSIGCSSSDSMVVSINPLPLTDAGLDTTVCAGAVLQLNASGAAQYSWEPVAFVSDSSITNPEVVTDVTRTYTVTGTSAEGCSTLDSVTVTVVQMPVVDAGPDIVICLADSVQLSVSGNATSFAWSPASNLSDTTIANPYAFSDTTFTYVVAGSIAPGCTVVDSVTVSIGMQQAMASADTAVCEGQSVQMFASGATAYSWSPAAGLSDASIANPVATPLATTSYEVTMTNDGGCVKVDTVVITVNPLPVIQVSNDESICFGDTARLSVTGAASFTWTPETGLNDASIANPDASPANTTVYTAITTDSNGCSSQSSVTVEVKPLPVANAGLDVSICEGSMANLNVVGGTSFSWLPAAGLSSTSIATPSASPAATTSYTVTVTGSNGCTSTDTVTVNVNASTLAVTTTSTPVLCYGQSNGTASVSVSGGSGNYSYMWFPGTATNPSLQGLAAGTYSVIITDLTTSCRDTGSVTVIQPADFSLLTSSTNASCGLANGTATVNVTGPGTFEYYWNTQPAQTTATATGLATGTYEVTVMDTAGCQKTATATVASLTNLAASFSTTAITGNAPLTVVFTNTSIDADIYIWNFGDGTGATTMDASHVYGTPGTYEVTMVVLNSACADTAKVTITVTVPLEFIIPNVFTPNGDNINDLFTINGQGMTDFTGKIFNRWGESLYEWYDPKGGWDGAGQTDGVYYFIIQFKPDGADKPSIYTGAVSLIRK